MNTIKVELLHHTPLSVALRALEKPYANQGKCNVELLKNVCLNEKLNERHGSVLEHIYLNFEILGSSRLELQEHMRHRIASPTVESTRYVLDKLINEIDSVGIDGVLLADYFVYPMPLEVGWDLDKECKYYDQYSKNNRLRLQMLYDMYKNFYSKKKDNDILKYDLPENFRVNMVWSINLRSFINFLKLRLDKSAHFEIKQVARLMWDEVRKTELNNLLSDGVWELIEMNKYQ